MKNLLIKIIKAPMSPLVLMENKLSQEVEQVLKTNELAEKKLVRKIYLIVSGMIFLLISIIIVEFKEYSNNYFEHKIGQNELGPKDLVWAGIMGTSPRYFESDEKHGLGYREYDTREIRKALEEAGINLIYRYMSPNRLEFEFERKHPICFYDKQWSNPKEYFKKKRHSILSIPKYYSGEGAKKIFFRKGEKARFEKHLDAKGNIILDSLIKDTSLKTELIRKVDYDGPYANVTYGKRQLDGTYYDYVKQKYLKNIDLVILHTNDQIIQMLRWKRFDYQFLDTLEYDDYPWMDGGQKGIESLTYEEKTVTSIDDPNFVFHSVACGNHPLTKMAMPIINEVIKSIRLDQGNYDRSLRNERKLNPLIGQRPFRYYIASGPGFGTTIEQADKWYSYQFKKLRIHSWPMFTTKNRTSPEQLKANLEILSRESLHQREIPQWNLIETKNKFGEKTLLVINDVDLKNKSEEEIVEIRFLDKKQKLETRQLLDRNVNFSDLTFSRLNEFQKIIIFSRGIEEREMELLKNTIKSPILKSLTLIEPSSFNTKKILTYLPENLEELRFYDVPLMGTSFSQYVKNLKRLKVFDIQASSRINSPLFIEPKELITTLLFLPKSLESLSIVGKQDGFPEDFPLQAAQAFANKQFSQLKEFKLVNFYLDDLTTKLILSSLPLNLESLIIGLDLNDLLGTVGGISSLLLEEFLRKRVNVNKLRRLHLLEMIFSIKQENNIQLPESLEDLLLFRIMGLNDGNFKRIIIPSKIQLKNLEIRECNLNDFSLQQFLSKLSLKVDKLVLNSDKLTGQAFYHLRRTQPIEIENFSIQSNPVTDFGMMALSKLPWKIKKLNISNLKISGKSSNYITNNSLWNLSSLNLSDNYLNAKSISQILSKYGKNLVELKLNNVLDVNINQLSLSISDNLEILSLAGNMLTDEDIILLSKNLPKKISSLDIRGSRMSSTGAFTLSKNMKSLIRFYFDFKFGEEEEGMSYIFQNLTPFLLNLPHFLNMLSYKNVLLLSENMPPYLYGLTIKDFENEECKILFASLPNSLRHLSLFGNIKSKGNSLNELLNHFPTHLRKIFIGNNISLDEFNKVILDKNNQYLEVRPSEYVNTSSYQFNKIQSFYFLWGSGPQRGKDFKNITFPASSGFTSRIKNDLPKGFLYSLDKSQLRQLRAFWIFNCKEFENIELFDFLKKLPSSLLWFRIHMTNLEVKDVDTFIRLLPKNLRALDIRFNSFGEEGLKNFREYKRKMEEKTGLPFTLFE